MKTEYPTEKHINSQALLQRLAGSYELLVSTQQEMRLLDKVMAIIRAEPAADVVSTVIGEWTPVNSSYWDNGSYVTRIRYRHSACGEILTHPRRYCPNCGCHMLVTENMEKKPDDAAGETRKRKDT